MSELLKWLKKNNPVRRGNSESRLHVVTGSKRYAENTPRARDDLQALGVAAAIVAKGTFPVVRCPTKRPHYSSRPTAILLNDLRNSSLGWNFWGGRCPILSRNSPSGVGSLQNVNFGSGDE